MIDNHDDERNDSKVFYVVIGLVMMIMASALFIFIRDLNATQVFGVLLLFIVGVGCAVAGTEDKRK